MFERLKRLFKPIDSRQFVQVIKHRLSPPVAKPEEFVSPLRTELTELMAQKPDIDYNEHCAHCRGHRTVDGKINTVIQEKEDREPWLEQVHQDIVANSEEQRMTRNALNASSSAWQPSKRLMYGSTAAIAATLGGLAGKWAWDAYIWPQILMRLPEVIPWLIHLFIA